MKKLLLISLALLALQAPVATHATQAYTVLLAGGVEESDIRIWLTPDGRQYVIDSIAELEVGSSVCTHPEGMPNELVCDAPSVAGFEINAGGGNDKVRVAKDVAAPVTMRGGSGDDLLLGGAGSDKLVGGAGDDRLSGWRGFDLLYGGPGDDVLNGGPNRDVLRGGSGMDLLIGGPGGDSVRQD